MNIGIFSKSIHTHIKLKGIKHMNNIQAFILSYTTLDLWGWINRSNFEVVDTSIFLKVVMLHIN